MTINAISKSAIIQPGADGGLYSFQPSGGVVSNLTATRSGLGGMALVWQEDISTETAFRVYRGTTTGTLAIIGTTPANTRSFYDSGLSVGQSFVWKVAGWDGTNEIGAAYVSEYTETSYAATVTVTTQAELNTELAKTAEQLAGQVIGVVYNATPYTISQAQLQGKDFGANRLVICTSGGTTAVFDAIPLVGVQDLTLYGLKVVATSATGGDVIGMSGTCDGIIISSCEIRADKYAKASSSPGNPYTFDGFDIANCTNITILNCHIHDVQRGMTISNCTDGTIIGNYITPQGGTGIQYAGGNARFTIERNHIEGQSYTAYPTDPDGVNNPHQSAISVRSNDLTIRGNVIHGIGSSAGIMFYTPDAAGGEDPYNDITLENNVLYDIANVNVLRIYNLGTGVVIRNNLFASQLRLGACVDGGQPDARYRYETAFTVHSLGTGVANYSGLSLHNNICLGIVNCGRTCVDAGNVIWSWAVGTTFYGDTPSGGTVAASSYGGCGTHPLTYENTTFFNVAHDYTYPTQTIEDWTLAAGSAGIDAGNVANQAPGSLGTMSGNYILNNGAQRSATAHDVGPYQT